MTQTPGGGGGSVTVTETYGIEWYVNKGAADVDPLDEEAEAPENPTEFVWESVNARLIGGPEQLVDFYVEGKVYLDTETCTTDEEGETSCEVVRTYPPYSLSNFSFSSDLTTDWEDPTNPAKPKQWGGPIIYKENQLPAPVAMSGVARAGISSRTALFRGFVATAAALPLSNLGDDRNFFIALDTGFGYTWQDSLPGAGAGFKWVASGQAKDPGEIDTAVLGSVNDLPDDAPEGQWAVVAGTPVPNVYAKKPEGWLNIGPIQVPGGGALVIFEPIKEYVSGYIYSRVFDQSRFRYIPRMSGGTQVTYQGEVDIAVTGWFPDSPYAPERDIYPMDSVTRVKPDGRESVTVTYTGTMTTDLATSTITVTQEVFQPTYNWGDLIQQLLETTYFYHGIYH